MVSETGCWRSGQTPTEKLGPGPPTSTSDRARLRLTEATCKESRKAQSQEASRSPWSALESETGWHQLRLSPRLGMGHTLMEWGWVVLLIWS